MTRTALAACLLLALAAPALAADDPDALRLQGRVNALRADPALGRLAAVEQMEAQGIVSEQGHNGNREVLAPPPFD